jgi:hypothetical protein
MLGVAVVFGTFDTIVCSASGEIRAGNRMTSRPSAGLHLALGTISFAICLAAWGLISAFAPM